MNEKEKHKHKWTHWYYGRRQLVCSCGAVRDATKEELKKDADNRG